RGRDHPRVVLALEVVRSGADGGLEERLLGGRTVDPDDALVSERPGGGAARAELASVLLEDLADLGGGAVAVVGHDLDDEERAGGPHALVEQLLVRDAL